MAKVKHPLVVDLDGTLTPTDTLVESIIQLVKREDLIQEMGNQARQYHQAHLGIEAHCKVFVDAWEKTAKITYEKYK